MTEAELMAEVTKLCDQLGLLWHHDPDSRRVQGTPGFPDLVIAGELGVIIAELKADDGDTSADQDLWLWKLANSGMGSLWKPSLWERGLIQEELRNITR